MKEQLQDRRGLDPWMTACSKSPLPGMGLWHEQELSYCGIKPLTCWDCLLQQLANPNRYVVQCNLCQKTAGQSSQSQVLPQGLGCFLRLTNWTQQWRWRGHLWEGGVCVVGHFCHKPDEKVQKWLWKGTALIVTVSFCPPGRRGSSIVRTFWWMSIWDTNHFMLWSHPEQFMQFYLPQNFLSLTFCLFPSKSLTDRLNHYPMPRNQCVCTSGLLSTHLFSRSVRSSWRKMGTPQQPLLAEVNILCRAIYKLGFRFFFLRQLIINNSPWDHEYQQERNVNNLLGNLLYLCL